MPGSKLCVLEKEPIYTIGSAVQGMPYCSRLYMYILYWFPDLLFSLIFTDD